MYTKKDVPLMERRIKYIEELKGLFFHEKYPCPFFNRAPYHPGAAMIHENGEYYLSVEDIRKLYSPDMKIEVDGNRIKAELDIYTDALGQVQIERQWYYPVVDTHEAEMTVGSRVAAADGKEVLLDAAPMEAGGILYLPVTTMMSVLFGARVLSLKTVTAVTFDEKLTLDMPLVRAYNAVARGKIYGDIYDSFWFEEGKRVIPYRAYIPTSYRPDKPNKALFYFHGGGGTIDRYFDMTNRRNSQKAEELGYILIGMNGFIRSSFFGSLVPIVQTIDTIDPTKADYDNPEGWPKETLIRRSQAMTCTQIEMNEILSKWNFDRKNMFATGNSAGSVAVMHYALNEPDMFNAVIPTGGFINWNFYDLNKIKELKPNYIFHIAGTEDWHGFDYLLRAYEKMDQLGIQYKRKIVGGANHPDACWIASDDMFDFCEESLV